jgi:hypothetical protein
MEGRLNDLWDLQEQYVAKTIYCYERGLISTGVACEYLGFNDRVDMRDFIERRNANGISLRKFKRQLWMQDRFGSAAKSAQLSEDTP